MSSPLGAAGCMSCEIYREPTNCSATDAAVDCPCPRLGACDPVGERCVAALFTSEQGVWRPDPTCRPDAGPCAGVTVPTAGCACRGFNQCDPGTGLVCECTSGGLFGCAGPPTWTVPRDAEICRPDAGRALDGGPADANDADVLDAPEARDANADS